MDVDKAFAILSTHRAVNPGKFYGPTNALSLGVGQFYSGISFPIFDEDHRVFVTAIGTVYLLTHECDIDQSNRRPFNTELLVCPIIDFRSFVEEYQSVLGQPDFVSLLARLGRREVYRLVYIPHFPPALPYGGLLYLNQLTSTHICAFDDPNARRICTVTSYGLREIDNALQNLLLRPKADALPLSD